LGECVRTPCLQACHIGNPYAFGMEHQSYFLHRLSWVSLSAILPSYAPISTFWGPRRIFGADKDSHFQVCVQIYRNRRGQTLKNTETDTVITIIRSPYRGRSKNTWLLGEPHPLLANVAFLEHLFCTTRSHLCPNPAIYMYILLYYYIIMSTSLYPLLYLDAWYGLQSSTFKLLEMNSRLRLECSSTERCQFRAMWLLSCVNMTSSIKPEVHNIATPPEDRATECTDR